MSQNPYSDDGGGRGGGRDEVAGGKKIKNESPGQHTDGAVRWDGTAENFGSGWGGGQITDTTTLGRGWGGRRMAGWQEVSRRGQRSGGVQSECRQHDQRDQRSCAEGGRLSARPRCTSSEGVGAGGRRGHRTAGRSTNNAEPPSPLDWTGCHQLRSSSLRGGIRTLSWHFLARFHPHLQTPLQFILASPQPQSKWAMGKKNKVI